MHNTGDVLPSPFRTKHPSKGTLQGAKIGLRKTRNVLQKPCSGMRSAGCAMPLTEGAKSALQADFLH